MKNKLITALAIISLLAPSIYASGAKPPTQVWESLPDIVKNVKTGWDSWGNTRIKNFLSVHHGEHPRLLLYFAFLYFFVEGVSEDVSSNLEKYILMNPDPMKPEVLNVLNFFISALQRIYILAIAATALYMLFGSLSPRQRALSKYMLGRLVLGFLLVSISPYIISLAFQLSSQTTSMILAQADSNVVKSEYNGVLFKCWVYSFAAVAAPVVFENTAWHKLEGYIDKRLENIIEELTPDHVVAHSAADALAGQYTDMDQLESLAEKSAKQTAEGTTLGQTLQWVDKIKIEPQAAFTFPFLMLSMLLVFGLYGFLSLRYIMVMVWTLLFPLTIFFSSFELTKGLGRNMAEQTIFWIIMQVFYAVSLCVVAVGFALIPAGYEFFGIGPGDPFAYFSVSFFTIGGLLVFLLSPLFLLMMTQRRTA